MSSIIGVNNDQDSGRETISITDWINALKSNNKHIG